MLNKILENSLNELLSQYEKKVGIIKPPIEIPILKNALSEMKKIQIQINVKTTKSPNEGSLFPIRGGFLIYFSKDSEGWFRRRLTICHEFIHIFSYDCNSEIPKKLYYISENICFKYARLILVPDALLKNLFEEYKNKNLNIVAITKLLSQKFKVSIDTIIYRLKEIELIENIIFIFWRVPLMIKTKLKNIKRVDVEKQSIISNDLKHKLSKVHFELIKDKIWNEYVKNFIISGQINNKYGKFTISSNNNQKPILNFSVICEPKSFVTDAALKYNLKPNCGYEVLTAITFLEKSIIS